MAVDFFFFNFQKKKIGNGRGRAATSDVERRIWWRFFTAGGCRVVRLITAICKGRE